MEQRYPYEFNVTIYVLIKILINVRTFPGRNDKYSDSSFYEIRFFIAFKYEQITALTNFVREK